MTLELFHEIIRRYSANLEPRRARELEDFFRNELFDDVDEIVIGQSRFHPADVLEKMKPSEYALARSESDSRYYDQISEIVCAKFPSPIARPFHDYLYGQRSPLRRLLYMKDTWEAAVAVVHGILVAECAEKSVDLSNVLIRMDGLSNPTNLRGRHLLDWRISTRLGVVEGILVHAEIEGIDLAAAAIIPIDAIGEMRQLNQIRNEFSHSQTQSDRQANRIIEDCKDDLLHVLGDLQYLQNIELFRIDQICPPGRATLEVEKLAGHTGARRIDELSATPDQVARCFGKESLRNFDRVLIKVGSEIHDASPFFYCSDDDTGHRTKLHRLKQHKSTEGKIFFEVTGEAVTIEQDDADFIVDIERVMTLAR